MTSPISDEDNTEYVSLSSYYWLSLNMFYRFRLLSSPTKKVASLQKVRFQPKPIKSALKKSEVADPMYVC